MPIVHGSKEFLDSAVKLPLPESTKLSKLISLLELDIYHPLLHTKKLSGKLAGQYSFRVNRDWRVIFHELNPGELELLKVVQRKDAYR